MRYQTALISLFILFQGCGQSPLLHHDAASSSRLETGASVQDEQAGGAACPLSFPKTGFCASIHWIKQPGAEDGGQLETRFRKTSASPGASPRATKDAPYSDPPYPPSAKLWMPAMGHGSSPTRVEHARDPSTGSDLPGRFLVTNVYFVMPGEWEIHIQLKNGASVVEEAVVPIKIQ